MPVRTATAVDRASSLSSCGPRVVADMTEWLHRPVERVYVAVFIDAIVVEVRDGQATNRPAYAAIGLIVPVAIPGAAYIAALTSGVVRQGVSRVPLTRVPQ